MAATTDPIANVSKSGVEIMLGIANTQFAAFESLSALNFNATKAAFEAGIGQTRALLGAEGVQELASLNSAAVQPNIDNAISYSRSVCELTMQTQSEIAKLIQSQAAEFNKNMVAFLENISKDAPTGSEVAVATVKSALVAANSAYESIAKAAMRATEMAEANFTTATHVAKEVKKKAA